MDRLVIAGRTCLLLTHAGETLAAILAREGPPSLDFARRWGDDLLRALEMLEEHGVQHRDVKPANVGVPESGSVGKKARHLLLFDFSLSTLDPSAVTAGTAAYREPFVIHRRWDAAADRFSAAVTPRWGSGDVAAVATEEEATIEAERFQ